MNGKSSTVPDKKFVQLIYMNKYDVSCGKGRRGCCIIIPDSDSGIVGNVVFVYGPSTGGSPGGQMVLIVNPKATGGDSKTDR